MQERRTRRSNEPNVALTYQLQACVERAGARFMLLADDRGHVVASTSPDPAECQEAAEHLAWLGLCDDSYGELWRSDRSVAALAFTAQGKHLIVGIGGPSVEGALPEVRRAIDGVKRILS